MAVEQELSPGTVSKILWHFTGGPAWNLKTGKQTSSPKPAAMAYENLKSILRSKEVRLGTYKEVVKVVLPELRKFNPKTKRVEVQKDVPVDIESSSICCVSDIPAAHLRYHSYRYGKFALGFHRNAIIRAGFNPVFYTLQDTPIVRSIYEGFSSLDVADPDAIRDAASTIKSEVSDAQAIYQDSDVDVSGEVWEIESEVDSIERAVSHARQSIEDLVAFVKTFEKNEFSTVYCEREWRSTKAYKFKIDDLAMIVLPKAVGDKKYYESFVEKVAPITKLPRRIPVVPWDDLVEH
ncbi:MAG: hypothetical protein JSW66_08365 [Phycisphaerales bacterium]|nr:MAG: hypothetical protein JSW66_08365 [Phycisphaerales bacterium]